MLTTTVEEAQRKEPLAVTKVGKGFREEVALKLGLGEEEKKWVLRPE